MTIMYKIEKLQQLDQLIRLQCTGTPGELAKKLQVSESSFYHLLTLAKNLGAQITYNNCSRTYEYIKPMQFVFGFLEHRCVLCKKKSANL